MRWRKKLRKNTKTKMTKKKIITHNGSFHVDEVFAVAALLIYLNEEVEVVRTRDEEIIKTGDYIVDVGFVYDESNQLFDHHQEEGAGERENNIPYASFGLVWKKFGEEICNSFEIAGLVDEDLIQPIDAYDNGITLYKRINGNTEPLLLADVIDLFNSTFEEGGVKNNENFLEVVAFAKRVIEREIVKTEFFLKQKAKIVKLYNETKDKRLINFDVPISDTVAIPVLNDFPEPLFYTAPAKQDTKWKMRTVLSPPKSFNSRKLLPEAWAGKREEDLVKVTGVKDAFFVHNKRFIATAGSRDGIIKLAKLALDA